MKLDRLVSDPLTIYTGPTQGCVLSQVKAMQLSTAECFWFLGSIVTPPAGTEQLLPDKQGAAEDVPYFL